MTIPGLFGQEFSGIVEREGRGELEGGEVLFTVERDRVQEPPGVHEVRYFATVAEDPDWADRLDSRDRCLAALDAGADLSSLLPWSDVDVGDHWYTGVETFRELCWPSGQLRFLDRGGLPLSLHLDERLGRQLDGTMRVELTAIQRHQDVRYARLDFVGRLEAQASFDYENEFDVQSMTLGMNGPIGIDLVATIEGHLWWNLDAGHLDRIELEGDIGVIQDLSRLEMPLRLDVWSDFLEVLGDERRWSGKLTASAEFERL